MILRQIDSEDDFISGNDVKSVMREKREKNFLECFWGVLLLSSAISSFHAQIMKNLSDSKFDIEKAQTCLKKFDEIQKVPRISLSTLNVISERTESLESKFCKN